MGAKTRIDIHLKCLLFLFDFNRNFLHRYTLVKLVNIIFHEYRLGGSQKRLTIKKNHIAKCRMRALDLVGCCEHGKEPSASIKDENFLD
jgi:hypothetical protein